MEKVDLPRGWKETRFNIGRFDPKNQTIIETQEITEQKDNCCTKEQCSCGCYVSVVDFDKLDQQ